ncbi:MAG: cell division protein ZipA [Cellvibrionales bacterium]
MDLTIRDWMIVLGAGLILLVLADAVRRIYTDRKSEVRLNAKISRREEHEDPDDEFNLLAELPNGGARIVSRDDLQPIPIAEREEATAQVEPPQDQGFPGTDTPSLTEEEMTAEPEALESEVMPSFTATAPETISDVQAESNVLPEEDRFADAPDSEPRPMAADRSPETLDWLDALDAPEPEPVPEARLPRAVDPHVFVLNVTARAEQGFAGSDILAVLLACDLRFGDMDFFHRHEQSAGRGPIQFSVCNMMRPGVFDIDAMDSLRTRGLMFFVTLPGPEDMLKAFDYMHETAKVVAKNLDGDVLDETRSAITRQSLEHMRQQIRELERRLLMQGRG